MDSMQTFGAAGAAGEKVVAQPPWANYGFCGADFHHRREG